MSVASFLGDRLREHISQVAISGALLAIGSIASQPAAYAAGSLPLWLGLVQPLIAAVIAVLIPNGAIGLAPATPSTNAVPTPAVAA